MIFGFNTDIKHDDRTYHVQSEARIGEQLLQTQVFVQGRCIAKRDVSYAERVQDPTFTEEVMHETLREQHRSVVDAIRDGNVGELAKVSGEIAREESQLALRFTSSSRPAADSIVLCFTVCLQDQPVRGASVHAHLLPVEASEGLRSGTSASAVTDSNGVAEVKLLLVSGEEGESNLVVQAVHQLHKTVKKFRLKAAASSR